MKTGIPQRVRTTKLTIHQVADSFRNKMSNKRVLVYCDFSQSIKNDGTLIDISQIRLAINTVRYLQTAGASQIVLMSHFASIWDVKTDKKNSYSFSQIARVISNLMQEPVDFVENYSDVVSSKARIVLLENTSKDSRDESDKPAERIAMAEEIITGVMPNVVVLDRVAQTGTARASVVELVKQMRLRSRLTAAGQTVAQPGYSALPEADRIYLGKF